MTNIEKIISDLTKVKSLGIEGGLYTIDISMKAIIDYAFEKQMINNAKDLVSISLKFPELSDYMAEKYDQKNQDKIERYQEQYDRRFAGTYNSLREVPGYGTEWNERCIPDGVVIRSPRNNRC